MCEILEILETQKLLLYSILNKLNTSILLKRMLLNQIGGNVNFYFINFGWILLIKKLHIIKKKKLRRKENIMDLIHLARTIISMGISYNNNLFNMN